MNGSITKAASAVTVGAAITVVGVFMWVDALNTFTNPNRAPSRWWIAEAVGVSAVWCVGLTAMFIGADRLIQKWHHR